MASVFDTIKQAAGQGNKSLNWYRNTVNRLVGKTSATQLFRQGTLNTRPSIGRLNLFGYDPKLKRTLPYYDVFPLTVVLKRYAPGFLGFNMHYIAPRYRVQLMTYLYEVQEDSQEDTYFRVRWQDVKSVSRLRWAKPCLKQYYYSHINSRIVEVKPEHMDFVTLLPSQRFRKGVNMNKFNANDVYRDSQKIHG